MTQPFKKTVRIGTQLTHEGGRRASVFRKIEFDGRRLSTTGIHGPQSRLRCTASGVTMLRRLAWDVLCLVAALWLVALIAASFHR